MKTTTKHTPGPWTALIPRIPHTRLHRMILGRAFDGSEKAIVDRVRGGSQEQANANAYLIAAAPDLLMACQMALNDRMFKDWPEIATALIAAIAKAEGTT